MTADVRGFPTSLAARYAIAAGTTVGFAIGALFLLMERTFGGFHGKGAILMVALFLVVPAVITTVMALVAGYVVFKAGELPEGPKRASYLLMAAGAVASLAYFYATHRGYPPDVRDYATILAKAWVAWLAAVFVLGVVSAAAQWVLAGYTRE